MKNLFDMSGIKEAYMLRHEPENLRQLASIYWMTLMVLAGVIIVASLGYGVWQFLTPPDSGLVEAPAGQGITGFNRAQLKEFVQTFEKRQTDFEALITK